MPVERDRAGAGPAQTSKGLSELDLTVAVDAGDAENLASANLKRQRAETGAVKAIDCQANETFRRRALGVRDRDIAPDHHFRELGLA